MTTATPTLSDLAQERKALQLDHFDYEFVWNLGARIRTKAVAGDLSVAIEVRHGTDVIFSTLVGGATIDNFDWARRKSAVAHRFHKSSLEIRVDAQENKYDFNDRFRLPAADYVASGGAFPLILRGGLLIGTAAVSGLPDVEDHKLVVEALKEMTNRSTPETNSSSDSTTDFRY
ncbi:heme-degrading domain-containing protein [Rhizobium binxianense]|uniref:heme-degrading domain-containing protein n=1 Tax=Rhizobium binxianense TaxID=3024242 RepID=UPI00236003BF|nr:heme-degrading domain-containing protein [Rhizobium sp. MC62]MDC9813105.1 heme-degrading domain-containing protein [Rhizobium sp. MC62]